MGGGTLDYDGYEAYIGTSSVTSFTISGDHDFVMVVTNGVTNTGGSITYNGKTYNFKSNQASDSNKMAGVVLLPNAKDNTTFTFSSTFANVGIYGLSYQ